MTSVGKKLFKTINSKCLATLTLADALPFRGILLKKRVIWLPLVISILPPCPQECLAVENQKSAEFVDSDFVSAESRIENIKGASVGIPQGGQRFGERFAELDSRHPVSITSMDVEQKKPANQRGKNGSDGGWDVENVQWFLAGIVLMCLADALFSLPNESINVVSHL